MEIIYSSAGCQEAYVPEEDSYILGSSFSAEDGVDMTSIRFNQEAWEDEKRNFKYLVNQAIEKHEARYGTLIVHIALAGEIGLWNGTPIGGRMIGNNVNPLDFMGDVDEIEVEKDEKGEVTILGHHHDGTHRMKVFLLSEGMLNKINPNWNEGWFGYEPADFIKIYETRKPMRVVE